MNKSEKKFNIKIILYIIISIVLITLGVTFAYFAQGVYGNGTTFTTKSDDLRIIFTDSAAISQSSLEPGWSSSKTFTVENKTTSTQQYNLVIKNFINTYQTTGYLKYRITSDNNGYNLSLTDIPKQSTAGDYIIASSISIASNTTQSYTIYFEYPNDPNASQNADMGKILSGTLAVEIDSD